MKAALSRIAGSTPVLAEDLAQAWIDTQPLVAAHFGAEGAAQLVALMETVLEVAARRDATPLGPAEETLHALRHAGMRLAVVRRASRRGRAYPPRVACGMACG